MKEKWELKGNYLGSHIRLEEGIENKDIKEEEEEVSFISEGAEKKDE